MRASGPDGIPGELSKYGCPQLFEEISNILNRSFEQNIELEQLHKETLIVLQKEGKPRGPISHLRPLIIILDRIRNRVEHFMSLSQSGFRPNRSYSDAVWAHKWLTATTQQHKIEIEVLGIDMSSAFDTIDRGKLLANTKDIFGQDAWRMTKKLLSKTSLEVKLKKETSRSFITNVGSLQGDALSPVLFKVYLTRP